MTIEVLYPELCQLFGDSANVRYLRQCLPGAQFVFTDNRSEPLFVRQKVDLLYIGSMSESAQMLAVSRLRPYIPQLRALIDDGVAVLVTGNAIELFGQAIEDVSGSHEEMLGMYRFITRREDRLPLPGKTGTHSAMRQETLPGSCWTAKRTYKKWDAPRRIPFCGIQITS